MIKLINKLSGGDMYVHESRLEEYLKAGHQLAQPPAPKRTPAKRRVSGSDTRKK